MTEIIRHPRSFDVKNARNRSRWYFKFYSGQHFPDLRSVEQYRQGEWIALQQVWRRRALDERRRPSTGRTQPGAIV